MPDYIQLLESKLSPNEKQALNAMTDLARARQITVFLTGGAVRDIVSGASVRDLDITVQANPLKFKKDLERAGFTITGEHEPSHTLYLRFGKQARMEISAARTETFAKPSKPEYSPAGILDDLHRRDFTANAMALSLNEGSWGLLLDPLNGTADISARQLRLVSNYGFLEDPIRLIRAVRLMSRTGWDMEERTKARYDNAKAEGVITAITPVQRGYELEEIGYEEEPQQVLKALEAEGWLEHLSPNWSSRSVDVQGLERLHEKFVQLLMAGLHPDPSAAQFRLLTAKLSPAHLSALKKLFVRGDLISEANALDSEAKHVLQKMMAKDAAKPSQLWKLLHSAKPEAVLWLFFTNKTATVQRKFESFFTKWTEARQKIPNAILQDMRILPDVEGYDELLDKLTFAFMDGELPTEEAIRKFAEPYSPPAPPPPVIVRRSRAVKRVTEPKKAKGRKAAKAAGVVPEGDLSVAAAGELESVGALVEQNGMADGKGKSAAGKAVAKPEVAKKAEKAPKGTPAAKAIKPAAKGKPDKTKASGNVVAKPAPKASGKSTQVKGKAQKAAIVGKAHGKASKAAHAAARPAAKKSAASARGKATASAKTAHRPIAKKAALKPTAAKAAAKKVLTAKAVSRSSSSAASAKSKPKKKSGK
ncbi:MAG TPA: CCA tRNA nucleotidyltransferase [Acidobacteriaceae bacterium]|nr:CCA tRNA nucleotidyltransferase [Acidobacteriaceae bacterium]